MELSAENLIPYLDAKPRFAHEIAEAYNTATGRYRSSWLERLTLRIRGEPTLITGEQVSRALDGVEGIVCTQRYYDIGWDPHAPVTAPMKPGWHLMHAKHP